MENEIQARPMDCVPRVHDMLRGLSLASVAEMARDLGVWSGVPLGAEYLQSWDIYAWGDTNPGLTPGNERGK